MQALEPTQDELCCEIWPDARRCWCSYFIHFPLFTSAALEDKVLWISSLKLLANPQNLSLICAQVIVLCQTLGDNFCKNYKIGFKLHRHSRDFFYLREKIRLCMHCGDTLRIACDVLVLTLQTEAPVSTAASGSDPVPHPHQRQQPHPGGPAWWQTHHRRGQGKTGWKITMVTVASRVNRSNPCEKFAKSLRQLCWSPGASLIRSNPGACERNHHHISSPGQVDPKWPRPANVSRRSLIQGDLHSLDFLWVKARQNTQ